MKGTGQCFYISVPVREGNRTVLLCQHIRVVFICIYAPVFLSLRENLRVTCTASSSWARLKNTILASRHLCRLQWLVAWACVTRGVDVWYQKWAPLLISGRASVHSHSMSVKPGPAERQPAWLGGPVSFWDPLLASCLAQQNWLNWLVDCCWHISIDASLKRGKDKEDQRQAAIRSHL